MEERGLSNDKWCHLQQRLSLLHKSGTIKNIILFHANQVISHLCFFNDKVKYPILLQTGATLPKIGARYMTQAADVFCSKPYGWPSRPMHQLGNPFRPRELLSASLSNVQYNQLSSLPLQGSLITKYWWCGKCGGIHKDSRLDYIRSFSTLASPVSI